MINRVKARETAGRGHLKVPVNEGTNSVHAYWRLEIIIMPTTPASNWTQGLPVEDL
jgi:hypothetical protein